MSLEIDIGSAIREIEKTQLYIGKAGVEALAKAHRLSLNRTLTGLRKEANSSIRARMKLKSGFINKSLLRMNKARGGSLGSMEASLGFSARAIPLLMFVVGRRTPRSQKGIPVMKRRPIKAQIAPGKKFTVKGGFIGDVKTTQVFKRAGKGERRVKKQGTPAVANLLRKSSFIAPLERFIQTRYIKEFNNNYKFFLNKIRV